MEMGLQYAAGSLYPELNFGTRPKGATENILFPTRRSLIAWEWFQRIDVGPLYCTASILPVLRHDDEQSENKIQPDRVHTCADCRILTLELHLLRKEVNQTACIFWKHELALQTQSLLSLRFGGTTRDRLRHQSRFLHRVSSWCRASLRRVL